MLTHLQLSAYYFQLQEPFQQSSLHPSMIVKISLNFGRLIFELSVRNKFITVSFLHPPEAQKG